MAEDPMADATRPESGGKGPDDAALEAAMAALLKRSSRPRGAGGPGGGAVGKAGPEVNGNGNGNGRVVADGIAAAAAEEAPAPKEVVSDLAVSPWAPATDFDSDPSNFALREAGFDTTTTHALDDLRKVTAAPAVAGPPAGPDDDLSFMAEPVESSRRAGWSEKRHGLGQRLGLEGAAWSTRRKELLPALVVGVLVLLGLAAVIASLTRGKGSDTAVKSATTSIVAAPTTTFFVDSVPPPPGPLPAVTVAPDTSVPAVGTALAPKKKSAPTKSSPGSGTQPTATTAAPAPSGGSPAPSPSTSTPAPTPSTSPSTTPSTSPTTSSPPTTVQDLCLLLPPDRQAACESRGR